MANGNHPYDVTATVMLPGHEPHVIKGTVPVRDELECESFRRSMKNERTITIRKHDGSDTTIQGMVFDYTIIQFAPHKLTARERKAEDHQPEPPEHESQAAMLGKAERGSMSAASRTPPRSHSPRANSADAITEFNTRHHASNGTRRKLHSH